MKAEDLRKSIIQEAVLGRLVPHLESESPAENLLREIRNKKKELIKSKIIRTDKYESFIYKGKDGSFYEDLPGGKTVCIDESLPFEIPEGWCWARLNQLALYKKGPFGSSLTKSMFVPKGNDTVKVYEQKNAIKKDFSLGEYYISHEKYQTMSGFKVGPDDIIVSCAGTIGETYMLPKEAPEGIINQALMLVRLYNVEMSDYWQLYFEYILLKESAMKGAGSAIKNIPPFEFLKSILIPIPPLEEQKRIIKRIESLFDKVSQYKVASEKMDAMNNTISKKLYESLLLYAVQGKLVSQEDGIDSSSDYLKSICDNRRLLCEAGKLTKKDFNISLIYNVDEEWYERVGKKNVSLTEDVPYDQPKGWFFTRLSSICWLEDAPKSSGEELPYLEAKYLRGLIPPKYLIEGKIVDKGTKVILVDGENSGEIFVVKERGYLGSTFRILGISDCIYEEWLHLLLENYRTLFKGRKRGAAIPHLNKDLFRNLIVGIPPKEEQKRIVSRFYLMKSVLDKDIQK